MTKKNPYLAKLQLDNGMTLTLDFYAIKIFHRLTNVNLLAPSNDNLEMTPDILESFYFACLSRENEKITLEECGDLVFLYPEAFSQLMELAAENKEVEETEVKKKSPARK